MGFGSKYLFNDIKFPGAFLKLGKNFNKININERELTVEAGASLMEVAKRALDEGLSGMEMTVGVPASIGGAVAMNFGAFGQGMKDLVKTIKVADKSGKVFWIENKEAGFRYRGSKILDNNYIVLEVILSLEKKENEIISNKMAENSEWRKTKQPHMPSFGSVFKNTPVGSAGLLIDKAGLKGYTIGNAKIWDGHANFIVNLGNATFKDVKQLIELCKQKVKEKFNQDLELEVRIIER